MLLKIRRRSQESSFLAPLGFPASPQRARRWSPWTPKKSRWATPSTTRWRIGHMCFILRS